MWRSPPKYFVRGLLVAAPLIVTFYLLYWMLSIFDHLVPLGVPGLGLLVSVVLVTVVGWLSSNVLGRRSLEAGERVLRRVPLVKLLYTSIKDLVGAFVGDHRRFDKPVLVALGASASEIEMPGFVTREQLPAFDRPEHVAVYFPQAYNFAGNVLLVPRARVKALNVSSSDLMTFIVSGGVSGFGLGPSMLPPKQPE
jgi:uncharacterized membrane protein